LLNLRAGGFLKSGENGGIGDRGKAGERASAEETDPLIFHSAPDNRGRYGPRIVSGQLERLSSLVITALQPDRQAAAGYRTPRFHTPDSVPGTLQGGEGPGGRAGVGIGAGRIDVEVGLNAGQQSQDG